MRNLKKVLALVLALVMAMSLVTIANAADFSDNADIDYSEAVDVMVAAGIIDGVGNNSFDPNGTLTREQAAKLITYMLLGENSEKLGVEGTSLNDVAATRWSAPAIEYCAAMGIIDGAGDGNFYPAGKLTGYAFAKMLLTALGYDSQIEKFVGAGWTIPVATIGMEVGLDNGLERTFGNAEISRQEAAQMALNAIKAPLVQYPNKGNTVSVNGVVVDFTSQQYEYITTTIARQQTISDQKLSNSDDYTIEFGEKYLPKLELRRETDAFGHPAYTWAYDKKEIGNYLDDTDLVAEFTTKVTGKDLYDAITKNVMEHLEDKVISVYIDGETESTVDGKTGTGVNKIFTVDEVKRTNNDGVGGTEKGVLTQVFVTRIEGTRETTYDVKVVIINTYLAIASEDYDSKNGEVDVDVFALDVTSENTSKNPDYIKNAIAKDSKTGYVYSTSVTVEDENIDVSAVKEDDMFLVTVADGKVQTMVAPEVVADATIDSFKKGKDVTVEGKTYEYANTAKYDDEVLEQYSNTNLKDTTFNVILDPYGYLIGIEQNQDPDQYVFLTGIDGKYSPLSTRNADANIIHMDGTMETVTVNFAKSAPVVDVSGEPKHEEGGDWTDGNGTARDFSQINTWCTYSVNSAGVYTLKEVLPEFPEKGTKVAQAIQDASGGEIKIDRKNVSLNNAADDGKVYGNDNTVYINVETKAVKTAAGKDGTDEYYRLVIDDVDSIATGTKNVSLVVTDQNKDSASGADKDNAKSASGEVYTLYKDNGYIIAAVIIGEDDGAIKTYAYVHSDDVKRETYSKADDEWTWVREAIVDGKVVDLKEVGDGTALSELEDMDQNNWYELKLDADGNVKDATLINSVDTSGPSGTHTAVNNTAANAKDYVFCAETDHFDTANPVTADYPKFVGAVEMVRGANLDNDTVILFQKGFTVPEDADDDTIEYKDGTLYINTDDVKGFDVSPEVKTVLCLSDGEGNAFDDVDDSFTGYRGLENAIRNLDSNFTGDLSVVFDKGSAVVIIFNDTTDAEEEDDDVGPAKIVSDDGVDTTDPAAPTLNVNVYGGASVSNAAIKKYLEETFGGTPPRRTACGPSVPRMTAMRVWLLLRFRSIRPVL